MSITSPLAKSLFAELAIETLSDKFGTVTLNGLNMPMMLDNFYVELISHTVQPVKWQGGYSPKSLAIVSTGRNKVTHDSELNRLQP